MTAYFAAGDTNVGFRPSTHVVPRSEQCRTKARRNKRGSAAGLGARLECCRFRIVYSREEMTNEAQELDNPGIRLHPGRRGPGQPLHRRKPPRTETYEPVRRGGSIRD